MEQFDSTLSSVIDSTLGMRCRLYGYQYSEIIRSLMSVYFCGGSCIEDVTSHLMYHLSLHPTLRTCSADTILRAIKELTQDNISYTSDTGKTYDFNTADKLNTLLLNCLLSTGQLKEGEGFAYLRFLSPCGDSFSTASFFLSSAGDGFTTWCRKGCSWRRQDCTRNRKVCSWRRQDFSWSSQEIKATARRSSAVG